MSGTSLLPMFGGFLSRRRDDGDPTLLFRREMNRLFDDFFTDVGMSPVRSRPFAPLVAVVLTPQIEVSETDKEVRVTAELPGIDPKSVEVSLQDDVLTIRAEKAAQQESKDRNYHVAERSYGTFTRYLRLPFKVEPGDVRAAVRDGVLTVTIPKPQDTQQAQRIEVSQETGAADQNPPDSAAQQETGQPTASQAQAAD